jgi:hypothetical protein
MAAIPDPVTQPASVPSMAARAAEKSAFVGFQCLEYKKHPSVFPSNVSVITSPFEKAKVEESEMEGFTPSYGLRCMDFCRSTAGLRFIAHGFDSILNLGIVTEVNNR